MKIKLSDIPTYDDVRIYKRFAVFPVWTEDRCVVWLDFFYVKYTYTMNGINGGAYGLSFDGWVRSYCLSYKK